MLATALLALAPLAQEARQPVLVTDAQVPLAFNLEVASTGDHVVSTWRSSGSASLFLSRADGRGLAWSTPLELDVTPGQADVTAHRIAAVGGTAWIAWDDTRDHLGAVPSSQPTSAPYLRPLDIASGALGNETALPVSGSIQSVHTTVMDLDVAEVGGAVHVHVLLYARDFLSGDRSLTLASSHDGGASFPFVEEVADALAYNMDQAQLVVDGATVHVVWEGGALLPSPLQVSHQRSSDGGMSLDFAQAQILFEDPVVGLVGLRAAGANGRLVVGWTDQEVTSSEPFSIRSRARAVASLDAGTTFSGTEVLDEVDSPYQRLFVEGARVDPATGSGVFVWSETNIDAGNYTLFHSTSGDGGGSWLPATGMLSGNGSGHFALLGDGSQRGRMVAVRAFRDPFGFSGFDQTLAALSTDGGLSFGAPIALLPEGHAAHGAVYNDLYQNVVALAGFASGTELKSGGFRPQTLDVNGYLAGAATLQVSFERFDDGNTSVWLLASGELGGLALPFGDGRLTGLGLSPLLLTTVGAPGVFLASLDAAGSAALPPIPTTVPAGLTLHFAAVTIDLATLGFGDISDVQTEAVAGS